MIGVLCQALCKITWMARPLKYNYFITFDLTRIVTFGGSAKKHFKVYYLFK